MNDELFDQGLEIRKSVLGAEFVEKSIAASDEFNMPMQKLVTEYCWGAVWGREELPKKTRSMLNIAMLAVLNRSNEFKLHLWRNSERGIEGRDPRNPAAGRHLCRCACRYRLLSQCQGSTRRTGKRLRISV